MAFSAAVNIFGARWLPLFEGLVLVFFFVGLVDVCAPLWVLAPKAPSSEVWFHFNNGGNWASIGAATIIGFQTSNGAFIGADAVSKNPCLQPFPNPV